MCTVWEPASAGPISCLESPNTSVLLLLCLKSVFPTFDMKTLIRDSDLASVWCHCSDFQDHSYTFIVLAPSGNQKVTMSVCLSGTNFSRPSTQSSSFWLKKLKLLSQLSWLTLNILSAISQLSLNFLLALSQLPFSSLIALSSNSKLF